MKCLVLLGKIDAVFGNVVELKREKCIFLTIFNSQFEHLISASSIDVVVVVVSSSSRNRVHQVDSSLHATSRIEINLGIHSQQGPLIR